MSSVNGRKIDYSLSIYSILFSLIAPGNCESESIVLSSSLCEPNWRMTLTSNTLYWYFWRGRFVCLTVASTTLFYRQKTEHINCHS